MNHPAARTLTALAVVGAVATGGTACGVSSQDRPQPVERTSVPPVPVFPSVATETRYTATPTIPDRE